VLTIPEAYVRKFLPALLMLLLPLAACENIGGPSNPDGSYRAVRVTPGDGSGTRSVPGLIYSGPMRRGSVQYEVRYELVDARIDLVERTGRYTYTGVYRLTERNGRFQPEVVTSTEYGIYDVFGDEISFREDLNSDAFLDANGRVSGRTIEVGAYDPVFNVRDIYEFRR
jgi:hypothetical protein